jgi:hypothetical protein
MPVMPVLVSARAQIGEKFGRASVTPVGLAGADAITDSNAALADLIRRTGQAPAVDNGSQ